MTSTPSPLFIDTGAFYAAFVEDDANHTAADAVFQGIQSTDVAYGPLFTSRYVLAELATLMLYRVGHTAAVNALSDIRRSESFNILPVDSTVFAATCSHFERYDDQEISFFDHTSAVLADEYDIEHIFAFDEDFRTLGFTLVPDDVQV